MATDEDGEAFHAQRSAALARRRADAEIASWRAEAGTRARAVSRRTTASEAYAASRAFFDHSLDAVLYTMPDGRILDANTAACRMLGMSRDEICRRGRAGLADPGDARWRAAVEERSRTGRFTGRLSMLRHDGTTFETGVSSAVFAAADGEDRTVTVIREVGPGTGEAAEADNVVLVDPSGVSNRPAFVHLAEQQRDASRHALGLVYVRLAEVDADGVSRSPSERSRRVLAAGLRAACRWGDVVGRVDDDDFAMLVRDEHDVGLATVVHSIHASLQATRGDTPARPHIHVGVRTIEPDDGAGMLAVLDDAARRMSQHVAWEHADRRPLSTRCYFTLDHPTVLESTVCESTHGRVVLTDREHEVLRLLATRSSFREIAQALYVSLNTVKTHVSRVYMKLGVGTRQDAVTAARRAGLLLADPEVREASSPAVDFGRIALVARALSQTIATDEILDVVVMQGLAGLDADGAMVVSLTGDELVPIATLGYSDASLSAFFPAPMTENLPIAVAAREQTVVCVANREDAVRRFPKLGASSAARSNAWIAAPLVAEGRTFGALGISFLAPHEFSDLELEYLGALADVCALALSRRDLVRDSHRR